MTVVETGVFCRQPGCTFGAGGRCANGLQDPVAEACPDLGQASPSDAADQARKGHSPGAKIHSGEPLDSDRASGLTAASPTRVVVLAGTPRAGKTTLLNSIFDAFGSARIGEYSFAGSQTILAFERSCHDARVRSGRDEAYTERTLLTPFGEASFLHLRIGKSGPMVGSRDGHRDLLLTDLNGEAFEIVRDNTDSVARFPVLRRADHFVQVVDGAKLVDPVRRHGAIADARSILENMVATGTLTRASIVEIVATKWDFVIQHPQFAEVDEYWTAQSGLLLSRIRDKVGSISVHRTAGRTGQSNPDIWGVPELLRLWVEETYQLPEAVDVSISVPNDAREFDKLATRIP